MAATPLYRPPRTEPNSGRNLWRDSTDAAHHPIDRTLGVEGERLAAAVLDCKLTEYGIADGYQAADSVSRTPARCRSRLAGNGRSRATRTSVRHSCEKWPYSLRSSGGYRPR